MTRILLEEAGPRELVGVDPDPAEAALAERLGIYKVVHVAGGGHVPEPSASFDWAFSNSVLEHVEGIEAVLGELARLLRPGGRFVFTVPGPEFHACLRGPLLPGMSRAEYLRHLDDRLAHLHYWGPEEWKSRLGVHGLRLDSVDGYLATAEVQRWESISRVTAGPLYRLAGRRRQPIEIQRALRLRRPGRRLPLGLARVLGAIIGAGLGGTPAASKTGHGYLLIVANKNGQ